MPAAGAASHAESQPGGFLADPRGGVSLAKLAAKLLLVWCTAAKAVLEALNCFRTVPAIPRRHSQWFLKVIAQWLLYILFND